MRIAECETRNIGAALAEPVAWTCTLHLRSRTGRKTRQRLLFTNIPHSAFRISPNPIADSSSPTSAYRLLICHLFLARRIPNFWLFSPSRCDSGKNFIQMFDFFTIFARQIIPSLGTPYDALHN